MQKGSGVKSLSELLDRHITAILEASSPPYTIVGHSIGGLVGFLCATKLAAMGHAVESLTLLDPVNVIVSGCFQLQVNIVGTSPIGY